MNAKISSALLVLFPLAILTPTIALAQKATISQEKQTGWLPYASKAHLMGFTKVKTLDGIPMYKVSYQYDFSDARSVYIKGIGDVAAKGMYAYLTRDPNIEFRESSTGAILAVLRSSDPYQPEDVSIELPDYKDFLQPPISREGQWGSARPFQEMSTATIAKKKLYAYAYQQDGVSYLVTSYTGLEGMPKNLVGQISLRVSYPYRKGSKINWYRVEYTARERRLREEKWIIPARTPELYMACNKFVDLFVTELHASVEK